MAPDDKRTTALPDFLYAQELRTSGIYSITCKANGLVYIGSAVSISLRWRKHYKQLLLGNHHNAIMRNYWNKYGPEAFAFEVLEYCPIEALIDREQFHINACHHAVRANLSPTAGSIRGFKQSPEVLEVMRRQRLGIAKHTPETIARLREIKKGIASRPAGWKMTEEQKEQIRQSHLGKPLSEETKAKLALSCSGWKQTDDVKRKSLHQRSSSRQNR